MKKSKKLGLIAEIKKLFKDIDKKIKKPFFTKKDEEILKKSLLINCKEIDKAVKEAFKKNNDLY